MRVPDLLAPSELRLAALLFALSAAGYGLRAGRHLSPDIARWLDREAGPAAESTGTGGRGADVPARGSAPLGGDTAAVVSTEAPAPAPAGVRSAPRRPGPGGARPIDPNRAGTAELATLPGVGPVLARRIVEERQRSGGFSAPEDLLRVKGIGPATLERLRPFIRLAGTTPGGGVAPPSGDGSPPGGSSQPGGGG